MMIVSQTQVQAAAAKNAASTTPVISDVQEALKYSRYSLGCPAAACGGLRRPAAACGGLQPVCRAPEAGLQWPSPCWLTKFNQGWFFRESCTSAELGDGSPGTNENYPTSAR
jgi:hypothetical protein